jgi:hypothetical protein
MRAISLRRALISANITIKIVGGFHEDYPNAKVRSESDFHSLLCTPTERCRLRATIEAEGFSGLPPQSQRQWPVSRRSERGAYAAGGRLTSFVIRQP